jgi:hypothetical protein
MNFKFSVLLLGLIISAPGNAEEIHKENTKGVEALSAGLRDLLNEEMRELEKGMMSIIPAYISGDWAHIGDTAGKMQRSYILKQSLDKSQVRELQTLLPVDFITRDKRFHYLAGMLEHAAKSKKPELINFYFSEMNESCTDCHARYATHKFPALGMVEDQRGHEH